MRNYIILNGNNSNTISGLLIQSLPPISKPLMRTAIEEIDGRDGDIVTNLGYSAYDKEVSIGLYGTYDVDEVIKYFNDNSKGQVTFSNEPDKYYNYEIINQIDFERLIRFKTATVTLHCQPFKYDEDEEQIQVDATQVTGEGTDLTLEYTIQNASLTLIPKGDTQQDSTTGQNLFNIFDPLTMGDIVSIDNDGWITVTYDNSSGTSTKWFDCKTKISNLVSTDQSYKLVAEIKSVSGTGTFNLCVAQAISQVGSTQSIALGSITTGTKIYNITMKDSFDGCTTFLNSCGKFEAGQSGSITLRISVVANTSITPETFTYEPYTNGPSPNPDYPQDIQVVTGNNQVLVCGKNLCDGIFESGNINNSGSETTSSTTYRSTNYLAVKGGETLICSYTATTGTNLNICACYDKNKTFITRLTNLKTDPFTLPNNTAFIRLGFYKSGSISPSDFSNVMLVYGTTATPYEAYQSQTYPLSLGSIELCKSSDGTYQDYFYKSSGTWYKKGLIGKKVFDGNEGWSIANTIFYYNDNDYIVSDGITVMSSYFAGATNRNGTNAVKNNNPDNSICGSNTGIGRFYVKASQFEDTTSFTTWLSTHNTEVRCVLATPTDTEITDSTLISQLDAILNAYCYQTTTNVITSGTDLPIIVNATTSGMANTIVKNKGNIIAKPLMTIYGSGNIGVYFNEIQVIQIALGDESQITIDVANMEAYNQETLVLKNRLVTGDYNNMVLNTGDNEITFSGNVLGFTMDKYSRWL